MADDLDPAAIKAAGANPTVHQLFQAEPPMCICGEPWPHDPETNPAAVQGGADRG